MMWSFVLSAWGICVFFIFLFFFIKRIISGNHNQPCIFSLSTQGRLFSRRPEGRVVIMSVSVCEWVSVCLRACGVKLRHCRRALGGKIRAVARTRWGAGWALRGTTSMCNTSTPGGNTGETNRLITATLSRSRRFLWGAERWALRNEPPVLTGCIFTFHLAGNRIAKLSLQ